jgi:hypothetical protein
VPQNDAVIEQAKKRNCGLADGRCRITQVSVSEAIPAKPPTFGERECKGKEPFPKQDLHELFIE